MDRQSRISIGAGAFFALAALAGVLTQNWLVIVPFMLVCVLIIIWGIWPKQVVASEPHVENNGAFAGRGNLGSQTVIHGGVTIHQSAPRPATPAPQRPPRQMKSPPKREWKPGADLEPNLARPYLRGEPLSAQPSKIERDTKLAAAISYAVFGKWDAGSLMQSESGTSDKANDELKRLRQFARDGELQVWGRNYTSEVYDPIPANYWSNYNIDFLSLFRKEAHVDEDDLPRPPYRGLMVSKAQVEKLWPQN